MCYNSCGGKSIRPNEGLLYTRVAEQRAADRYDDARSQIVCGATRRDLQSASSTLHPVAPCCTLYIPSSYARVRAAPPRKSQVNTARHSPTPAATRQTMAATRGEAARRAGGAAGRSALLQEAGGGGAAVRWCG
eukprot:2242033-Prymnesium_polylepis.1